MRSDRITRRRAWIACAVLFVSMLGALAQAGAEPLVRNGRYAHSLAALGFPGARRAFQVGDGSQVYAGDLALRWSFGEAAQTTPVYFETDGVPVAHWSVSSPTASAQFEAAAVPVPALGDSSLVLSVRLTVASTAAAGGPVRFGVQVASRPDGPHFPPWDARRAAVVERQANEITVDGRIAARVAESFANASADSFEYEADLGPGEKRVYDFAMPAYPTYQRLDPVEHERVVAEARDAWRALLAEGAAFSIADAQVDAAWRAALVTLLQCQERFGDDWAPMGNPFQYRDIWLRDGARVVRALAVAGHTQRALANAWSFRHFQLSPGPFMSQRGQLDGTGQALWAFAESASLPPNPEVARRFLPLAGAAFLWLESQRQATRDADVPWPTMLPYADPRDNERTRGQLIGNDAWSIAGYDAARRLALLAERHGLAEGAAGALADYRSQFAAAIDRLEHDDIPSAWQGDGRDWGNLVVGYPTRALRFDHPRLQRMSRRLWATGGRPGLLSYGAADSLHTYLGCDLVQWAMRTGNGGAAVDYVEDFIAGSSSTLGQAEIFERHSRGFGRNLPPHTTAAATFIDLVRNMIVVEEDGQLLIGLGAPIGWWEGTLVERAPTYFGRMDVALRRDGQQLTAEWSAVEADVRIRVPEGFVAVDAGAARIDAGGRWIELDAGATRCSFRVERRGGRS